MKKVKLVLTPRQVGAITTAIREYSEMQGTSRTGMVAREYMLKVSQSIYRQVSEQKKKK